MPMTDETDGAEVTDRRDFVDADRCLTGMLEPMVTSADGRVVWRVPDFPIVTP